MTTFTGTGTLTDKATGLTATLSAPFTVGPAAVMPKFGMNYDVDGGLPAAAATLGCNPFPAAKVFNSSMPSSFPGKPIPSTVTWPLTAIKLSLTSAAPWLSSADQAGLAAVFASMPTTGTPMATINQEGEADRFGYSAAQVCGSHQTAYQIFKAHAPANAIYCQDFQTYTASPASKGQVGFAQYVSCAANGGVNLPLYMVDWYPNSPSTNAVNSVMPTFNAIMGKVPGAVIGVAECYYQSTGITWTGGPPEQWFADAWAWAVAHQCLTFILYALAAHNTPWPPTNPAITAELSSIAHASGL